MKVRFGLLVIFSLVLSLLSACGSGGAGLNGSLSVTASATGSTVNATAAYTNPTATNLIGVPISFVAQVGGNTLDLGTINTNNSGSVSVSFTPAGFNGSKTITVVASTGNLTNFATFVMAGRSLTFTPPSALNLTTTAASGTQVPFSLPASSSFIAVSSPFGDASGLTFNVAAVPVSTAGSADTLTLNATTATTNTGGTASFSGANGLITVPSTVGGVTTMTITWTVIDSVTGLNSTGTTTTITLTKTA